MRSALLSLAAALALLPAPALAWGKTGHRVVGQIASDHLTPAARAGVQRILGVETLAEAANWPDFMRSDPSPYWQHSTPWHYVTVLAGKTYAEVGVPKEGDAVTALTQFTATLRDPKASLSEKQAALRFVVHIIGDLHQPLHAGNGTDRGGNDRKVTWFGRETNLHSVWDEGLIDETKLSYSEMAAWLNARITPADVRAWSVTDPRVYIAESAALRDRIYPPAGEDQLSYRYVFDHEAQLEERLEQGGIRVAAYLNDLFAAPRATTKPRPHRRRG